jgi:hypothetical protein
MRMVQVVRIVVVLEFDVGYVRLGCGSRLAEIFLRRRERVDKVRRAALDPVPQAMQSLKAGRGGEVPMSSAYGVTSKAAPYNKSICNPRLRFV